MSARLPRGVEALLRRLLPGDLVEPIAGDLLEEYLDARARRGAPRAHVWVWWQAIRLAATLRWDRAAHGRPLPPIGDDLRATGSVWDSIRQDVIFGARMLRRQPGFTAVALVALSLGIGASTAMFSIVDTALWRPLPFPRADRIMSLAEQRPREGRWFGPIAPADFFDWRRDNRSFSALAAYMSQPISRPVSYNLTGTGEPERVRALQASPAFLGVLGISPVVGRDFRPEEEIFGRHRVVLLADSLWRRRFGADPSIVGRAISFDGAPYEVIGLLPARFWWPSAPEVIVPLALEDSDRALRSAHFLDAIGRLRDGVSEQQARDDLRAVGVRLAAAFPAENARHAPNFRSLRDALVGDVRPALLILLGAVAFVMLIACANVATLLLARAAGRQRELSVRRALGATRGRVVQQMLTESVAIALAGGAAGLLLAAWCLAVFRAIVPAQLAGLPGIAGVGLDGRALAAALALSTASGLIFGVLPALAASDRRLGSSLAEETRGASGGARAHRLRSTFVVAELALSLVLLAGAALLILSFRNLMNVSPGFQPRRILTAQVTLPWSRYPDHTRTMAFFDALYERLGAAPRVERVAATTSLPFDGADSRLNFEIEHRTLDSPTPVRVHPRLVSPGYFSTMGIPVVRGRGFTEHDDASSVQVAIVNEAAARRYWPGDDPIGQRISIGAPDRWLQIVGIVGDTRHEGLDADTDPAAYLPQRQPFTSLGAGFERSMAIVVRTDADVAAMAATIRGAVAGVDALLPIGMVRPMTDLIDESVASRRLDFMLVSAFALVAVVLTAAGLYGVMAYVVVQRTREIGVRMALGATRAKVLALMFRQAGALTAVGVALGVVGALLLTRSMTSLLFGVSAADPIVLVLVSSLLTLVAVAAVAIPSSRATRIDPLVALRD